MGIAAALLAAYATPALASDRQFDWGYESDAVSSITLGSPISGAPGRPIHHIQDSIPSALGYRLSSSVPNSPVMAPENIILPELPAADNLEQVQNESDPPLAETPCADSEDSSHDYMYSWCQALYPIGYTGFTASFFVAQHFVHDYHATQLLIIGIVFAVYGAVMLYLFMKETMKCCKST